MAKEFRLAKLPLQLPSRDIDVDLDPIPIAESFTTRLRALIVDDFESNSLWRDVFALTGTLHCFYGSEKIISEWRMLSEDRGVINIELIEGSPSIVRIDRNIAWVNALYTFQTVEQPATTGKTVLSVIPGEDGRWRIWTMRTVLDQIIGYPDVDHLEPEAASKKGDAAAANGTARESYDFECVIVGCGHSGLNVAGRLKALNVSYVVLDKNANVGDSWNNRYDAVKLHITRDASHLAFGRTFPAAQYPKFLRRKDVVQGYEDWTEMYGINIWLQTQLCSGKWDEDRQIWTLEIADATGIHPRNITAKHVVMATGAGGAIPKLPTYQGLEKFKGASMHSSQSKSASAWKNRKAVVVGSAVSAHDIAEDMLSAGCSSVTMVQRSPTFVFTSTNYTDVLDLLYHEDMPTELADLLHVSSPPVLNRLLANQAIHQKADENKDRFDALEKTGFKLVRKGDIVSQLYEHFGGFYMDVGATDKIIRGQIKVKSDALIDCITPDGIRFTDGSHLEADLLVFATGYEQNTTLVVERIFGAEISSQIEEFWTLNEEGEIRGAFKPCGNPHLWMIGGSTYQTRFYSRFIAFHIKAALDGSPLKVC